MKEESESPLIPQMRHMTPGEGGQFNDRGGEVLGRRMNWGEPQPLPGDASGPENLLNPWNKAQRAVLSHPCWTGLPWGCCQWCRDCACLYPDNKPNWDPPGAIHGEKARGTPHNSKDREARDPSEKGQLNFQTVFVQVTSVGFSHRFFHLFS